MNPKKLFDCVIPQSFTLVRFIVEEILKLRDALECVIDSSSCGGNLYRSIGITIVGKQLDFLRRLHRGTRPRVCES